MRRFLDTHSREYAHHDHVCQPRFVVLQNLEHFVERNQIEVGRWSGDLEIGERHPRQSGAALVGEAASRMVDEYAPHRPRGRAKEMAAVFPGALRRIQPQVNFVHQCSRLQCVAASLPPQLRRREAVQLAVDQRIEPLERLPLAAAGCIQQERDLSLSHARVTWFGRSQTAGIIDERRTGRVAGDTNEPNSFAIAQVRTGRADQVRPAGYQRIGLLPMTPIFEWRGSCLRKQFKVPVDAG